MTSIFLQAASPASGGATNILFLVGFIAIFYFFMIRPSMKRAKDQKKFQESIKVGDSIMTSGGIYGEVIEVHETAVVIKLDQGRMKISKAAVSADRTVTEGQEKK